MTVERGAVFQDLKAIPPPLLFKGFLTTLVAAMLLDPLSPLQPEPQGGTGKGAQVGTWALTLPPRDHRVGQPDKLQPREEVTPGRLERGRCQVEQGQDEGQRLTQVKGELGISQVAPDKVSQVPHCGERGASADSSNTHCQGPAGNLETSAPGPSLAVQTQHPSRCGDPMTVSLDGDYSTDCFQDPNPEARVAAC